MIVSRAPVRITLAGGGTDVKSYYQKNGGFLIAAGINKYTWITANRGYYDYIHLKYSGEEKVKRWDEIQHPLFREVLHLLHWEKPVELISSSDVPVGCGLGSSGSFTVALVNLVNRYVGNRLSQRDVAEIACNVEIEILKEPIGKQDQYACALGGINCYTFRRDGYVEVEPLKVDEEKLNKRLLLFDTSIPRSASDIWAGQKREIESGGEIIQRLDTVKEMAFEVKWLLGRGLLDDFGLLLNDYWNVRKQMSSKVSNPVIDEAYEVALQNGALGGKLQGAGGGGFLMFYSTKPERLTQAMVKLGLKPMDYSWDFNGVQSWNL